METKQPFESSIRPQVLFKLSLLRRPRWPLAHTGYDSSILIVSDIMMMAQITAAWLRDSIGCRGRPMTDLDRHAW